MPSRRLRDSAGLEWEVFEVRRSADARAVSGALRTGWLTFQSATAKRRLPNVPPGWAELPEQELWALFARALVAPPAPAMARGRSSDAGSGAEAARRADAATPGALDTAADPSEPHGEESIRAFARRARQEGVPVVHALVELKRRLDGAGGDSSPASRKRARGWFVETYYLARPGTRADD